MKRCVIGWHGVAACGLGCVLAVQASAQIDRIQTTPTGWWWMNASSATAVNDRTDAGYRPFAIDINAGNTSLYSALFVANTGSYAATGGDTIYSQSWTTIRTNAIAGGKRVLDLTPHGTGTSFSAVVVDNAGIMAASDWDMAANLTGTQLVDWPGDQGLRPIDVEAYTTANGTRYSVVGVANTGNNAQGWWWYFGVSAAQVSQFLTTNGARLIDIDVVDTSPLTFNCIMVSENTNLGVWYPAVDESQFEGLINQHGARISCIDSYEIAGVTAYALALVDNSNAQSRRMRSYLGDQLDNGDYGFRLQRVGGGVECQLNDTFVYEPASMLKILHAAYAMDQIAAGNDSLSNLILIRDTCNNNECPNPAQPCSSANETMSDAIREMMEQSDNNRTMEIELRYGRTNLNNYAAALGLAGTDINHWIGCGTPSNTFRCVDACNLYEYIADNTLFAQNYQDTLYELMVNGNGTTSSLSAIIDQEAASTNLTSSEIADFKSRVDWAAKGGRYTVNSRFYRSEGGWASLPHRSMFLGSYLYLPFEYTMSAFVHDSTDDAAAERVYSVKFEILREQIREALDSWDDSCTVPNTNVLSDRTVFVGDDASFTVSLRSPNTGERAYQWQRQNTGGTWSNLANQANQVGGATTATLTLFNVDEADERAYRCVVSSSCGSDTTNAATLTVNPLPTGCDDIDFNNDGVYPDADDIAAFLAVSSGTSCIPCNDIDFNNDGVFPDSEDLAAFLRVYSGGPC